MLRFKGVACELLQVKEGQAAKQCFILNLSGISNPDPKNFFSYFSVYLR
jgi:hypothetical protein